MKKIFLLLLFLLFPMGVFAYEEGGYVSLNFAEVLKEEEISADLSSYQETDEQVPIYLFRGKGCKYCRAFLTFLTTIVEDYGRYFKLVSYEVRQSKDTLNAALLDEVATYMDQPAGGVPYIVIGDKVFTGYSSGYDTRIKNAITDLYQQKDRFDVIEALKNNDKPVSKEEKTSIPVWVLGIILGGVLFAFLFLYWQIHRMKLRLNDLQREVQSFKETLANSKKKSHKDV